MDRLKRLWWQEPELKKRKLAVPRYLKDHDPLSTEVSLPTKKREAIGGFKPSRLWVRYNRLQSVDVGYLVPVYDLRQIGLRFGLSHNAMIYFRKHLLPEPFDVVRRRALHAHHWPRFTLMALDVVLTDLEQRGHNQFLKSYDDHVSLLHNGERYMADYYGDKALYDYADIGDEFGVSWF